SSIAFLEKLPTFLCSEIARSRSASSMLIKYGRIEETRVDGKEISTHFRTLVNFGEVEFADIEQARAIFGADGLQLYRTHWAVREGNAREVLTKLVQLHPKFGDAVTQYLVPGGAAIVAEPPPRSKKIIGVADSVEAFLELLYSLPTDTSTENFF